MKRLKFFWPYLLNKNPKIGKCEDTPFHFVTYHGLSDVADFMIEEMQSSEDCLCLFRHHHGTCYSRYYHGYCHFSLITNNRGTTPLHNMTRGHAEIIRSLRRKLDFELIDPYLFNRIILAAVRYENLDCIKALIEKQSSSFQKNAVDTVKNYYYSKNDFWMNQNYYKFVLYLTKEFIGGALYLIFPVIMLTATFILYF